MQPSTWNTLILLALTVVVGASGYYLTEVRQPQTLEQIEQQDREARLRNVRVEELLQMEAQSAGQAEQTVRQWKSRYKIIPATIETPDVVQYIERLTSGGFEEITIAFENVDARPLVSAYRFKVSGVAYFRRLYDLVWQLENNRQFYHVRDLNITYQSVGDENPTTGRQRKLDMVSFNLLLDAFFGASEGISPATEELADLPASLLPARSAAHDSFYPLVRADLPTNDRGLLDVETAKLVSIVGGSAVFEDETGQRQVREGDEVYLGTIVKVDPVNAFVRASLNKGGVTDVVEIPLSAEGGATLPRTIRRTPIRSDGGGNR